MTTASLYDSHIATSRSSSVFAILVTLLLSGGVLYAGVQLYNDLSTPPRRCRRRPTSLVAMGTIFAADAYGLPVSTTHILTSGVAGTMAATDQACNGRRLRI